MRMAWATKRTLDDLERWLSVGALADLAEVHFPAPHFRPLVLKACRGRGEPLRFGTVTGQERPSVHR